MSTHELDTYLRKAHRPVTRLTADLAVSQTPDATVGQAKTLYRLYTEDIPGMAALIGRYFDGATLLYGLGLDARTQEDSENSVTIEIVTSKPDALQRILDLAGDIRVANNQISVLVTRQPVTSFEVTERTATHGEL